MTGELRFKDQWHYDVNTGNRFGEMEVNGAPRVPTSVKK
jgi:hypothetical protein